MEDCGSSSFGHNQSIGNITISDNARVLIGTHDQRTAGLAASRETLKPSNLVPFPRDENFINRPEVFFELDQAFEASSTCHRRAALWGLGGVGKSQIAIEYCYRYAEDYPDSWILWVYAGTVRKFVDSFERLAARLDLLSANDSGANTLETTSRWLGDKRNGCWLLVVDNADDEETLQEQHLGKPLDAYLPQPSHGRVLLTSRSRDAAASVTGSYETTVSVGGMLTSQSLALLNARTTVTLPESRAAEQLCQALDCIPLAISHAGAYISRMKLGKLLSITKYLELFNETLSNRTSLLNSTHRDLRRDPEVPNSTIATWEITFDQLQRQHRKAAELLSLLAMYHHQKVPEQLLTVAEEDRLPHQELVATLLSFAMIVSDDSGGSDGASTYSMHSIVQFSVRRWLQFQGAATEWQSKAVKRLHEVFPWSGYDTDYDTWALCDLLMPHAAVVSIYSSSNEDVELDRASIRTVMSRHSLIQGYYDKAIKYGEASVDILKTLPLPQTARNHIVWFPALSTLGEAYYLQGLFDKALEYQSLAFNLAKAYFGEECIETLNSMHGLANLYRSQEQIEKASEMETQILTINRRILDENRGDENFRTQIRIDTYELQGQSDEAESLLEQKCELSRRVLGEDHPGTFASEHKLIITYLDQERWDEALTLLADNVDRMQRVMPDHPATLRTICLLAFAWNQNGDKIAARTLMEQVEQNAFGTRTWNHPWAVSYRRLLRESLDGE